MAFARVALVAALALTQPARAAIDPGLSASIQALAAKDLRVASIAYRLQTAAVDQCKTRTRLSGLIVQDITQYRADLRPAMAALYNLNDVPAVTGVVPGGAGDRAGLRSGDEIVEVNGTNLVAGLPSVSSKRAIGDRFAAIVDRLDDAFQRGPVTLAIRRGGFVRMFTVTGAPACASQIQLDLAGNRNAGADGKMVTVSQGIVDFTRSDDELAFVIGHELSHNILGHRDFLDATKTSRHGMFAGLGGNGARVRETEQQADYLGLYLVALAGYDYHAAGVFWQRMGRSDPIGSLLPDGTHPGNAARVRSLENEAREIDAKRAAHRALLPDPEILKGSER
jgi:Zn-dependent protease with chaperone function